MNLGLAPKGDEARYHEKHRVCQRWGAAAEKAVSFMTYLLFNEVGGDDHTTPGQDYMRANYHSKAL